MNKEYGIFVQAILGGMVFHIEGEVLEVEGKGVEEIVGILNNYYGELEEELYKEDLEYVKLYLGKLVR